MAERVEWLDGLRGWAAFVTVTGHLDMWWHTGAVERGYGYLHNVYESTPISLLSYIAVNLFFIISGFALSYPVLRSGWWQRTLINMAAVRYFRLAVPVTASVAIAYCLWTAGLIFSREAGDVTQSQWMAHFYNFGSSPPTFWQFSLYDVFWNYRHPTWNPVLWTMKIEMVGSFYLFALLALPWRPVRICIALVFAVYLLPRWSFGFTIGYLAAEFYNPAKQWSERTAWAWLGSGFAIGTLLMSPYVAGPVELSKHVSLVGFLNVVAAVIFIGFMLSGSARAALSNPVSQFLGRISFPLYLMHFLVIVSLGAGLSVWLLPVAGFGPTFLIVFGATIIVSILVSIVFQIVVEGIVLTRVKAFVKELVDACMRGAAFALRSVPGIARIRDRGFHWGSPGHAGARDRELQDQVPPGPKPIAAQEA